MGTMVSIMAVDMLNMKPLFNIGDIIASFTEDGRMLDKPSLIIEITNKRGFIFYKGLRQDPEDIKINGASISYSQLSVARFKVIGHNPAAQVLYSTKES